MKERWLNSLAAQNNVEHLQHVLMQAQPFSRSSPSSLLSTVLDLPVMNNFISYNW
jgi:hypothetical protein